MTGLLLMLSLLTTGWVFGLLTAIWWDDRAERKLHAERDTRPLPPTPDPQVSVVVIGPTIGDIAKAEGITQGEVVKRIIAEVYADRTAALADILAKRPALTGDTSTFCETCSGTAGWYCTDPAHEHVPTVRRTTLRPAPSGGETGGAR